MNRWTLAIVALGAALVLLSTGVAAAKKPVNPTPPPADSGVIYAEIGANLVTMDTDGTDVLGVGLTRFRVPSTALHDGKRWFLELRLVENESYPSSTSRHELFAVTAAGQAVQLTNDANIEPNNIAGGVFQCGMQWATDAGVTDGKVSYLAIRWSGSSVVEHGLYVVEVDPDDILNHDQASCGAGAEFLALEVRLNSHDKMWTEYDWSPDGESIVFHDSVPQDSGIQVAHGADDWSADRIAWGRGPRWSPCGTLIAFEAWREVSTYLGRVWDIHTVEPDGVGEKTVITVGDLVRAGCVNWSPSGDYFAYLVTTWPRKAPKGAIGGIGYPIAKDVYRAEYDGSGAVNLTDGPDDFVVPVAWVTN